MKNLFTFIACLIPMVLSAQGPIYRQTMTTNQFMNNPSDGWIAIWNAAANKWSNGVNVSSSTNIPAYLQTGTLTNLAGTGLSTGATNAGAYIASSSGLGSNVNIKAISGTSRALVVNTNVLVVTNGNVGIGTDAPGSKLDVNGAIAVNGGINAITTDIFAGLGSSFSDDSFAGDFVLVTGLGPNARIQEGAATVNELQNLVGTTGGIQTNLNNRIANMTGRGTNTTFINQTNSANLTMRPIGGAGNFATQLFYDDLNNLVASLFGSVMLNFANGRTNGIVMSFNGADKGFLINGSVGIQNGSLYMGSPLSATADGIAIYNFDTGVYDQAIVSDGNAGLIIGTNNIHLELKGIDVIPGYNGVTFGNVGQVWVQGWFGDITGSNLFSQQIRMTGGQASNSFLYLNATTNVAAGTFGNGFSFSGGTLTAGGAGTMAMNLNQFDTNNPVSIKSGALFTNAAFYGTFNVNGSGNSVAQDLTVNGPFIANDSLRLPRAAAPTTDDFGELAADNDAWAASRGAPKFFDGTSDVFLVGALASDTPSNGQVPVWNTGGTITWETPSSPSQISTNGTQFGASVPITVKSGALFTNAIVRGLTDTLVTGDRAAGFNSNGDLTNSPAVSMAELEFLDGVTSAIQTQLNGKMNGATNASQFGASTTLTLRDGVTVTNANLTSTTHLTNSPVLRFWSTANAYTEFAMPSSWAATNRIVFFQTNAAAGKVWKVNSVSISGGVATVNMTNDFVAGTEVTFSDPDGKFAATDITSALAELNDVNGSGPNASDGKVNWTQLVNVPAGFADGTDDGGAGGTNNVAQGIGTIDLTNAVKRYVVRYNNDTNIVVDWTKTNYVVAWPSNSFTVSWVNVPAGGTPAQSITLEIVNTNSTAAFFPTNGLNGTSIIMLAAPSTNLYTFNFDGTNFWTESGQILTTGTGDTNVFNVNPDLINPSITYAGSGMFLRTTNMWFDGGVSSLYSNVFESTSGGLTNILATNIVDGKTVHLWFWASNGVTVNFPQFAASDYPDGAVVSANSNCWTHVIIDRRNTVTNISIFTAGLTLNAGNFTEAVTNYATRTITYQNTTRTTNYAQASSITINASTDVRANITNAYAQASGTITLATPVLFTSGSLSLVSDASARTIAILCPSSTITWMSTNYTANATNILTTASKRTIFSWRHQLATDGLTTNTACWTYNQF